MSNTGRLDFDVTGIAATSLIASELALSENLNFTYTTDAGSKRWISLVPSECTIATINTETEYYYGSTPHVQNALLAGEQLELTTEPLKALFYWRIFAGLWAWQNADNTRRIAIRDYNFLTPSLTLNTDSNGLAYVNKTALITSVNIGSGRARLMGSSKTRPRHMEGLNVSLMVIY